MVNYELEEGQIVQCTVDKILGTTVFVKIDNNGEGTLTTSEIAPGRIRNLRDYVVPGKKIVCKILRMQGDKIHLSLRRVKQREKKELLDKLSKEKSYKAILKTALEDGVEKTVSEITKEYALIDFFEQAKQNPKILEKYLSKTNAEKIIKILESKKEKLKEIKQNFKLENKSKNGINTIKQILQDSCKGTKCQISYLAAGKYRLSIKGEDFKEIKTDINQTLNQIEVQAKKTSSEFNVEKN